MSVAGSVPDTAPTAPEALARLLQGNARFVSGQARTLAASGPRPEDVEGQHPWATILGCSDSRVPPELVFDAGLGDVFVIRIAGNVTSPEVAGSLQYARRHLRTPLFLVLGHEGCGAVKAALAARIGTPVEPSRIQILLDDILPALADHAPGGTPAAELARAVEANVRWTVKGIRESSDGRSGLAAGEVAIVGAVYELATGRVRLLV